MQPSNVTCSEGSDANFTYISDTMICMTTASVCQDYVQARLVLCRLYPSCLQVHTESQSSLFLKQLTFFMNFYVINQFIYHGRMCGGAEIYQNWRLFKLPSMVKNIQNLKLLKGKAGSL